MSDAAPTRPEAPPRAAPAEGCRVRASSADDAAAVAAAVERLLVELGGARPSLAELEDEARALAGDPAVGALLVAESGGEIVGVLAASWQRAIHVPGRYGTIQDIWVHPSRRSRAVGRDLLAALFELARERGIARIEVGLPQDSFSRIDATEAFYRANGFTHLGPRMRRILP